MANSRKPFYDVILKMVQCINVDNILDSERTKLGVLMDMAASCDIDGRHDEILKAFRYAYRGLMNMRPPDYFCKHIVAEKARCEKEARANEVQVSSDLGESLKSGIAKLAKDGGRIIGVLCEDSGCACNREDNPGRLAD